MLLSNLCSRTQNSSRGLLGFYDLSQGSLSDELGVFKILVRAKINPLLGFTLNYEPSLGYIFVVFIQSVPC